jgi:hypothetical protein
MRSRFWMAGLVVILWFTAASAWAEDCPAKSHMMDDIVVALNKAPNCDRALKIFEACEFGTSGDIRFGAVVEKKCERDFLGRLKGPQKLIYQHEMRVCDRKYRNEEGTMYRSFTAICRAEVARRYSRRALKAAGSSRAVRALSHQAASAALAFSAIAWNAAGSVMARSDSTLRSTVMPDFERPLIKTL